MHEASSWLAQHLPSWLYHILDWPVSTGKNGAYNFFSGIGIGGTGAGIFWHRHNCHQDRCLRIVRHGKMLCKKHEKEVVS